MRARELSLIGAVLMIACGGGEGDSDAGLDARVSLDANADPQDTGTEIDAGSDSGASSSVLFPPRDFVCEPGVIGPCPTTVPSLTDAQRTHEVTTELDDATFTYVIRVVSIPEAVVQQAAGFNLDGMDSGAGSFEDDATCEEFQPDFANLFEPAHPGTDNGFQALIPIVESFLPIDMCPDAVAEGCLDALILREINAGALLLVVEVSGVDSLDYDPEVEVALYTVEVPGVGLPELDGELLAPDQTFDTSETIAAPTAGDIYAGRVRVLWDAIVLPIRTPEFVFPTALSRVEMRADFSELELTSAHIGGASSTSMLATEAELWMPGFGELVFSILEGVADIDPPVASPEICNDISMGVVLQGVRAMRRP